jgi:hypothetical protein
VSLSVYREFAASYPEEVFQQIDEMAKTAAGNIKPSIIADYEGQKAIMKGCITFYESEELKSFINKLQTTN